MTLHQLHAQYNHGWLINQKHPTLPLTIWNYSQQTQYEGWWNEITLACRGLVTWDDTGEVLARPFPKFFNIEEGKHISTSEFSVYEKMDGSLIIAFYLWGSWVVASRGSFTSEQAVAASRLLEKMDTSRMSIDSTFLFEFTAPWNRIVVDYGSEEKLTLLGGIRTEDGVEAPYESLVYIADGLGCDVVKRYDGITDFDKLKELNTPNHEGFVVHFSNGDRCKIKFEDYVTLHKIITNVSSYDIWENLKSFGKLDESLLNKVPDEFYDWVRKKEFELNRAYGKIEGEYKWIYRKFNPLYFEACGIEYSRSEFAKLAKRYKYPGILFAMLDGKDYSQIIWKLVKPKYEKPFSNRGLEDE
jgi:T4 RnlA family RNA ligase